jgi:hypothetical protein
VLIGVEGKHGTLLVGEATVKEEREAP